MSSLRVYAIDGIVPVVDPTAYVHPSAVLIGDVIVGPGCYVGPCASLRGDFGRLILEAGANLQDTCVMHGFPGTGAFVGIGAYLAAVLSAKGWPFATVIAPLHSSFAGTTSRSTSRPSSTASAPRGSGRNTSSRTGTEYAATPTSSPPRS